MSFIHELKRRNVFRVGVAYVIVAWLLLQVADLVLNNIEAPIWVIQAILLVLVIGFPLSLFLAWAYELTPEGLKKETDVDPLGVGIVGRAQIHSRDSSEPCSYR